MNKVWLSNTQLRGLEIVLSNVGGISQERSELTEGPSSLLAAVRAIGRNRGIEFHRRGVHYEGSIYLNSVECPHCGRK